MEMVEFVVTVVVAKALMPSVTSSIKIQSLFSCHFCNALILGAKAPRASRHG